MPAIVEYPFIVKEAVVEYSDVFYGTPQREHFARYITGLIVSQRKTVNSIVKDFALTKDQSCLNRFLTEAAWDEKQLNEKRIESMQNNNDTKFSKKGIIAIDNVLISHEGKEIENVGYFWDHADKRHLIAHDYLFVNYVCPSKKHYPLDFVLFRKKELCEQENLEFKTHSDLFCELVKWTNDKSIPGIYTFDSYFTNNQCLEYINSFKLENGNSRAYVGDLKFNRKVNVHGGQQSISEIASSVSYENREKIENDSQWCWSKTFSIPGLDHRVRIVVIWDRKNGAEPKKILISNKTELNANQIIKIYRNRWTGTETFHRDGKQELGMGDCQIRDSRGQTRHMYLVMLVYSLLMKNLDNCSQSSWCVKKLMTIGEACKAVLEESFRNTIEWAIERSKKVFNNEIIFEELRLNT